MKILQIRFENLNSLVGEWNIDLTDPSYVSDGIFAITGPTGAGKSTILDAICLALYGRTPRLSRITKSENEIMSRHTGACFAEVTFQTRAGRYRCHWSQRRAREKPDGQLQQPKQELANADSGVVLQSKIKGVAEQIEDVTGMDFERFTRSMLLAQGDFAAFLLATADERAPILEQITGTEIYSEISILLHERQREEQGKLDVLKAKASGTVILELEQEQEIRKELEIKQKEETELIKSFGEAELAIKWLKAINSIKEEIAQLTEAEESLHKEINAFSPKRDRLNRANKAAALDGQYATLKASRKQHSDDQEELKIAEVALPKLISQANQQADILKSAEQQTRKAKTDLKAGMPQIQRVRALDQKLDEMGKSISEAEKDCENDIAKIEENRQTRLKKQGQVKKAETQLCGIDTYLKEHAQDEWLVGSLTGVEEQLNTLQLKYKEIARKDEAHKNAETQLKKAKIALEGLQESTLARGKELEEASSKLQDEEKALRTLLGDRLLREYRTEKENLLQEMIYLKRIVELKEHRTKLEDGKPCPLCGAKEHPFAEGNIPQPDQTERKIAELNTFIDKAEKQESIIRKLEKEEVKARDNLTECEKQKERAEHEKRAAETALAGLKESLEELRKELARLKEALITKLHPFGITDIPDSKIPLILASLRKALKEWQSHTNLKEYIKTQIAGLESEIKSLDGIIDTQSAALSTKNEQQKTRRTEHAKQKVERLKLYDKRNPDEVEKSLNKAIDDAEKAEREARSAHAEDQRKLTVTQTNAETLQAKIAQRSPRLNTLESDFSKALAALELRDEKQYLETILPLAQRNELAEKAKALDDKQSNIRILQADRKISLERELAKKITDKSAEDAQTLYTELEAELKNLRDSISKYQHSLSENDEVKKRFLSIQTDIKAQEKECSRWGNLHDLIGSADGKKYRNFAQGLTFEVMVGHANKQLQLLSERYLLLRDRDQPLELNVIDNHQAGEIRSTKNLSGGESFLVSLSLALGLSQMASRNVNVDSLFLDEGFGTLDEDTLSSALEALASMRQSGKLIGVISHVQAIKERIGTQIQVIPQIGGRSRILGVGCSLI